MIWLTWRQFRAAATVMAAALAALAVTLVLTGPGLADDYSGGIAACAGESGGCADFVERFYRDNRAAFLAVTAVALLLPAAIGLFWGAPLVARELEADTHRLVWGQSITRARWLAVKLGLVGLAAVAAAGLCSLAVSWWAGPVDKAAAADFPRMAPLVFDARGIVPVAYAAFAFALGVAVGMVVRRTLPAMALTLVAFAVVQIVTPLVVRPHLIPPIRSTLEISPSNLLGISMQRGGGPIRATLKAPDTGAEASSLQGAWILSSQTTNASGEAVESIPLSRSGPCAPSTPASTPSEEGRARSQPGLSPACFAAIKRSGYRQQVTYQPSSRYWDFQAYETTIFIGLSLLLAGFCFWWLRWRLP